MEILYYIALAIAYYVEPVPHNLHVKESELFAIDNYDALTKITRLEGARKSGNDIILRGADGEGSLIHIDQKILTPNWSFEMLIKVPKLKDIEKTGIYYWYTVTELKSGGYKGGKYTFHGFVVGLEFSKSKAEIVFSYNHGINFEKIHEFLTKYDCLNPAIINKQDSLKFKIIHTENNFKVEVFDAQNNLISDNFKMYDQLILHDDLKNHHLALTTTYNHSNKDTHINLLGMKMNDRVESNDYDARDTHTKYNTFPRNKEDEELRLASASLEHFKNYLYHAVGDSKTNRMIDMMYEIKKKTKGSKDFLEKLLANAQNVSRKNLKIKEENEYNKSIIIENLLDEIMSKISKFDMILISLKGKSSRLIDPLNSAILVAGVLLLIIKIINFAKQTSHGVSKDKKKK